MRDTGWFKSSYSTAGNDNCVEVRMVVGRRTSVRDSKNAGGDVLAVSSTAWHGFIAMLAEVGDL